MRKQPARDHGQPRPCAMRMLPSDLNQATPVRDQDVGFVVLWIEAVMGIERAAKRRLGAQQAVQPLAVVAQDELRPAGAKSTITVENDDRTIVGEFWNRGVVAIAVGLSLHGIIPPDQSPP